MIPCGNIPKVILPTYCIDDIYANREPRFYEEQAPCLRSERFGLKVAYVDNLQITGVPYIDKNYKKFYEEHGYIPEMFNAYNCSEITDVAPTLTCNCGSATTSSSVLKIEKINNKTEN